MTVGGDSHFVLGRTRQNHSAGATSAVFAIYGQDATNNNNGGNVKIQPGAGATQAHGSVKFCDADNEVITQVNGADMVINAPMTAESGIEIDGSLAISSSLGCSQLSTSQVAASNTISASVLFAVEDTMTIGGNQPLELRRSTAENGSALHIIGPVSYTHLTLPTKA